MNTILNFDSFINEKKESKKDKKFRKVMHEFSEGKLKASYGEKVSDRKQALAISFSESGK